MGKVYTEQLGEFEAAKECYAQAMASNMEAPYIYPDYIRTLISNEDYEEARKLLDFAMALKAADWKSRMVETTKNGKFEPSNIWW